MQMTRKIKLIEFSVHLDRAVFTFIFINFPAQLNQIIHITEFYVLKAVPKTNLQKMCVLHFLAEGRLFSSLILSVYLPIRYSVLFI